MPAVGVAVDDLGDHVAEIDQREASYAIRNAWRPSEIHALDTTLSGVLAQSAGLAFQFYASRL